MGGARGGFSGSYAGGAFVAGAAAGYSAAVVVDALDSDQAEQVTATAPGSSVLADPLQPQQQPVITTLPLGDPLNISSTGITGGETLQVELPGFTLVSPTVSDSIVTASSKPKVLQTGGNILKQDTLDALELTKEQGKRAMEGLKAWAGRRNDSHNVILDNGKVVDRDTGEEIGDLYDFVD